MSPGDVDVEFVHAGHAPIIATSMPATDALGKAGTAARAEEADSSSGR